MTTPFAHQAYHGQREADLVRAARIHPLAEVQPIERRNPLGRLLRRRRTAPEPGRVFKVA